MKNLGIMGLLVLAVSLTGCQASSHQGSTIPLPQAVDSSEPRIAGQVEAAPTGDRLTFRYQVPSAAFRTAALDFNQFKYLRLWVLGPGLAKQMWNEEGYTEISGNVQKALSIAGVPKGANRIVTAQAYDADKKPIPGATLKAIYSSPPGNTSVQVTLTWRFVPAGQLLEALANKDAALASKVDAQALQNLLDKTVYGANQIGGAVFAVHPSRLNVKALADLVVQNGGIVPSAAEMPANIAVGGSQQIVVQTPQGGALNRDITLWLNDPASTAVTIPAGTDRVTVSGIAPGTWTVKASVSALGGQVETQAPITVDAQGNITLAPGTLVPPPVVSGIFPGGLVSWWAGEGHARDQVGGNHGNLNGPALVAAKTGKGFRFDGVDDNIQVPDSAGSNLDITAALTVSGWVKWDDQAGSSVIRKAGAYVPVQVNGGVVRCVLWPGGVQQNISYMNAAAIIPGKWYHLVSSYDGALARTYVDGVMQTELAIAGALPANNTPFMLGSSEAPGEFFKGALDEVQVYNRALTLDEIQGLYQQQPESGLGRTLTIVGDGFKAGSNNLTLGNAALVPNAETNTALRATVPAVAAGPTSLIVATDGRVSNTALLQTNVPPSCSRGSCQVVTVAGTSGFGFGQGGYQDGQALVNARFNEPRNLNFDSQDNLIVVEWANRRIRQLAPDGTVSTVAGTGASASTDGACNAATFTGPFGIAMDNNDNIYITGGDMAIRKISRTPVCTVTTIAGVGGAANFVDGVGAVARFNWPIGMAFSNGKLYIIDSGNLRIRVLDLATNAVTTLAGDGVTAHQDGTGAGARFQFGNPADIVPDGQGNLYLTDGNYVRKIVIATGQVTTIAGSGAVADGDGTGAGASFSTPAGIEIDSAGDLVVSTHGGLHLRKVDLPGGQVMTLAGNGTQGVTDGVALNIQMHQPNGMAIDKKGHVYFVGMYSHRVRKLMPM